MTCSPYPTFFCFFFFFFSFISLTKLSAIFLLCRGQCNPPWWWWWQRLRSSVLRRDWIRSPAHINIPGHSLACSPQGKMNVSVLRDKRLDTDILSGRVSVEALGPWSGSDRLWSKDLSWGFLGRWCRAGPADLWESLSYRGCARLLPESLELPMLPRKGLGCKGGAWGVTEMGVQK